MPSLSEDSRNETDQILYRTLGAAIDMMQALLDKAVKTGVAGLEPRDEGNLERRIKLYKQYIENPTTLTEDEIVEFVKNPLERFEDETIAAYFEEAEDKLPRFFRVKNDLLNAEADRKKLGEAAARAITALQEENKALQDKLLTTQQQLDEKTAAEEVTGTALHEKGLALGRLEKRSGYMQEEMTETITSLQNKNNALETTIESQKQELKASGDKNTALQERLDAEIGKMQQLQIAHQAELRRQKNEFLRQQFSDQIKLMEMLAPFIGKKHVALAKLLEHVRFGHFESNEERMQAFVKGMKTIDAAESVSQTVTRQGILRHKYDSLKKKYEALVQEVRQLKEKNTALEATDSAYAALKTKMQHMMTELAELRRYKEQQGAAQAVTSTTKTSAVRLVQYDKAASKTAAPGGPSTEDMSLTSQLTPASCTYRVVLAPDAAKQGWIPWMLRQNPEAHSWFKGSQGLALGLGAYPGLQKMLQEHGITPSLIFENNQYYMQFTADKEMTAQEMQNVKTALSTAGFLERDPELQPDASSTAGLQSTKKAGSHRF